MVRLKPPFDEAQGGPEFIEGPDTTRQAAGHYRITGTQFA